MQIMYQKKILRSQKIHSYILLGRYQTMKKDMFFLLRPRQLCYFIQNLSNSSSQTCLVESYMNRSLFSQMMNETICYVAVQNPVSDVARLAPQSKPSPFHPSSPRMPHTHISPTSPYFRSVLAFWLFIGLECQGLAMARSMSPDQIWASAISRARIPFEMSVYSCSLNKHVQLVLISKKRNKITKKQNFFSL